MLAMSSSPISFISYISSPSSHNLLSILAANCKHCPLSLKSRFLSLAISLWNHPSVMLLLMAKVGTLETWDGSKAWLGYLKTKHEEGRRKKDLEWRTCVRVVDDGGRRRRKRLMKKTTASEEVVLLSF